MPSLPLQQQQQQQQQPPQHILDTFEENTWEPHNLDDLYDNSNIHDTLPIILEPSSSQTPTAPMPLEPTHSANIDSVDDVNRVDLLALLQRFFPDIPDVQFKSAGQRLMVEEAISRQRNFIGILPTGGGKSLVFMLPTLLEERFWTIVLIPNKMLLRDMLQRSKKAGIRCMQWTVNAPIQENVQIIFVALETAANKKFKMYVQANSYKTLLTYINILDSGSKMNQKLFVL
jgi:hypothetical protein